MPSAGRTKASLVGSRDDNAPKGLEKKDENAKGDESHKKPKEKKRDLKERSTISLFVHQHA